MNRSGITLLLALLGASAILPGCGSGGGGGVVAGIDRGGVYGSISGFSSVIVNGTHYEATSAVITINGLPATEADLEVGYVVVIQADIPRDGSTPQAVTIDFAHDVIGPLSAVSVIDNQATVLGQSVSVTDLTSYGSGITPASIDGLALLPMGTILRISGFSGANADILATRIELGNAGSSLEVIGIVENLDTLAKTFGIGSLVIDYQSANLQDFPSGQPQNGDRVKADGDSFDAGGALVANELELKEINPGLDENDEFEIEGLITDFVSAMQFSVSGLAVSTDTTTTYKNGNATMLGLNIRIDVEGRLDSNGVLQASKVEFSPDDSLRIEATVDSVNPLQVLGISVQTDELTIFEDKSSAEMQQFSLADINPTDSLRVVGYESLTTPGVVVATGITRTEPPLEILILRGIAEDVAAPEFSILGVRVITDGNTEIDPDFFATAQGRLVEVEGSTTGGSLVAEQVEFEN